MTDQLRFNNGKPKLTYWYSNGRALEKLLKTGSRDGYFETVFDHLIAFLDRQGDEHLAEATSVLMACMRDEGLDPVDEFCAVCEYGERKYDRGNYRNGAPLSNYLDSGLRHLRKFRVGESIDPESGRPHAAHALWNLVQALDQPAWRDDRLPAVQEQLETRDVAAERRAANELTRMAQEDGGYAAQERGSTHEELLLALETSRLSKS